MQPIILSSCKKEVFTLDTIRGMSHENLIKLAEDYPLIPEEDIKNGMGGNYGHSGVIQNYCHAINTQMLLTLPDIQAIKPSQELARQNASYWLGTLSKKTISIYTRIKTFCIFYDQFTKAELEEFVDDFASPGGKENLLGLLGAFKGDAEKLSAEVDGIAADLLDFSVDLLKDLDNFKHIKAEADNLYLGANGKLWQLQEEMKTYKEMVKSLNIAIGVLSAAVVIGIIMVAIGSFLTPTAGGMLITAGIAVTGTASGLLKKYIDERSGYQSQYTSASIEFDQLEKHCAVLQALYNEYDSLSGVNEEASVSLGEILKAWQTIGTNFQGIIISIKDIDGAIEGGLALLIKKRLTAAVDMVKSLKTICEDYETKGILEVIVDDMEVITAHHLPEFWFKKPIPGDVFFAYMESKRNNGFYNRKGRLNWHTRSDIIISTPCNVRIVRH